MPEENPFYSFEAQMARLKFIAQVKTQCQLADFLGVRQASISEATRRRSIPASWLVVLVRKLRVNPDWILEGGMPIFLRVEDSVRLGGDEGRPAEEFLRQMPVEALQKELLRRGAKPQ